jgi:hypothetical protein
MSNDQNEFSWRRDFKQIDWRATGVTAILRSVCAGVVWFVVSLVAQGFHEALPMLTFPFVYLIVFTPIGLVTGWLSGLGVPYVGVVSILMAFAVVPGDPLLYALAKLKPDLVPIENPRFLNFAVILFVLRDAPASLPTKSHGAVTELSSRPHRNGA